MTVERGVIFGFLEDAGRAESGGRQELTLREVFESYGGRGSGATRRLAGELDVSQRQVQRLLARETGSAAQTRGFGPKSTRFFRDLSTREMRRIGARFYRENPLVFADGSTFEMCYDGDDEGEREIQGDTVAIEDNAPWLNHFDRGADAEGRRDNATAEREYREMQRVFTRELLNAYGVGGDLDICDEDGGQNLSVA